MFFQHFAYLCGVATALTSVKKQRHDLATNVQDDHDLASSKHMSKQMRKQIDDKNQDEKTKKSSLRRAMSNPQDAHDAIKGQDDHDTITAKEAHQSSEDWGFFVDDFESMNMDDEPYETPSREITDTTISTTSQAAILLAYDFDNNIDPLQAHPLKHWWKVHRQSSSGGTPISARQFLGGFLKPLCQALDRDYHKLHQVHGDLNFDNIMTQTHNNAMPLFENLSGEQIDQTQRHALFFKINASSYRGQLHGSNGYLGPERVESGHSGKLAAPFDAEHSTAVDVFSLGVMVYEYVVGERLFATGGRHSAFEIFDQGSEFYRNWLHTEESKQSILMKGKKISPFESFLEHFETGDDDDDRLVFCAGHILEFMLEWDMTERFSVQEILARINDTLQI